MSLSNIMSLRARAQLNYIRDLKIREHSLNDDILQEKKSCTVGGGGKETGGKA